MIRVLIVADVRFYREGLAEAFARNPRLSVVGMASDGDEALARARQLRPDIVLLDTGLRQGLPAVVSIARHVPGAKVVALAIAETEDDVLQWAEAGCAGYVPRDSSLDDLIAAVEGTARGELHCSSRVAAGLLRRLATLASLAKEGQHGPASVQLTPREREVIELIDRGMSNKDIARHLGIEVATAKSHVHHIFEKLHVHRRTQAAAWMRRRGLQGAGSA